MFRKYFWGAIDSFYVWLYGPSEPVNNAAFEQTLVRNRPALLTLFGCPDSTPNAVLVERLMGLESFSPCFLEDGTEEPLQIGPIRHTWYPAKR